MQTFCVLVAESLSECKVKMIDIPGTWTNYRMDHIF